MQLVPLVLLLALVSCAAGLAPFRDYQEKVPDEYIIVLKSGATVEDLHAHMAELKNDFTFSSSQINEIIEHWVIGTSFLGIHARLSADMLARERTQEDVAYIEVNGIAHIMQDQCNIQDDVIWNLARINERSIDLVSDEYAYQFTGAGVDAYIIDTGILTTHVEFSGGRAIWGTNTVGDGNNNDCNGHGTHVAGTVAGMEYGLAKGAHVIAVKVLGCTGAGSWAGVISGIQWVVNNKNPNRRAVGNMSLGGGLMQAVNDATNAAVDQGVVMVVASGNSNADACSFSPASATKAISVVATTIVQEPEGSSKDMRATFSNFGSCTHIAAPGQLIKSAWHTSNTATNIISGTSMASPHVCGGAVIYLGQFPNSTPAQVLAFLQSDATTGVVDMSCGGRAACLRTPNNFLFTYTCNVAAQ